MAYTINLTDGTIFAVVADGTINTDSSQTLVGKNYAGYGEFLNENFIRMLENASNTSAPGKSGLGVEGFSLVFSFSCANTLLYSDTITSNNKIFFILNLSDSILGWQI